MNLRVGTIESLTASERAGTSEKRRACGGLPNPLPAPS